MKYLKKIAASFLCAVMLLGISAPQISAAYKDDQTASVSSKDSKLTYSTFKLSDVPAYSGKAYVSINKNVPFFTRAELTEKSFEKYSELDKSGRCGKAYACIGEDLMPTEKRGAIGNVKPTGWHTVKYDNVDGKYLYNRCHLIGYQLSGENANEKNLITGTRYMNMEGMLPFENMVADYVKETGNHVMYRVTPMFSGKDMLAKGVLIEAYSVEDDGDGICFNVFCYNVQPDIEINYANGESRYIGQIRTAPKSKTDSAAEQTSVSQSKDRTYILNKNTKKFHYPSCSSVGQMSEKNKKEYTGSRNDVLSMGYSPCKRCDP